MSRPIFWKYALAHTPPKLPLITSICSGVVSVVLKTLLPLLTVLVIDYAYPQKDIFVFTLLIGAGLMMYFLDFYFSSVTEYCATLFTSSIGGRLSARLFDKVLRLPVSEQSLWTTGDLTVRITADSVASARLIVNSLHVIPLEILKGAAFLAVIGSMDPMIGLLALTSIPIYIYEARFYSLPTEELQGLKEQRESELNDRLEERLISLRTIKAFAREAFELERFRYLWDRRGVVNRKLRVFSLLSGFTNFSTLNLWKTIILWFLGYEVIAGRISIGQVIALSAYLPMIEDPIRRLFTFHTEFKVGQVSLRRVDELLSSAEEASLAGGLAEADDRPFEKGEIRFESVSMAYGGATPILQDLSFVASPNSSFAIVGESGAGKTTLFNLLLGFYAPTAGAIRVDGEDLREISLGRLRRQVGVVFQDTSLFASTIRENILYGCPGASHEEMIEASRMAAAHEYICQLPKGYDTVPEHLGENLSGGLRQRIAIARALVLKPKILILDEATSALDAESEFLVQETLRRCQKHMTVLMVAHRLSTIKSFDQIVVLDKGRIVEQGTFSELIKKQGPFFRLYSIQFGGLAEFMRRFEIEFERTTRYGQELSLLMLVVGEYERFADQFGSQRLAQLMERIELFVKHKLRVMDFAAVFRMNKIVLGLPETPVAGARVLAARLKEAIEASSFDVDGLKFTVTIDSGAASLKETSGRYPEEIYDMALRDLESV